MLALLIDSSLISRYAEQNRALLDTQCIHQSNNNRGHIVLYLIRHTQYKGHMCVSLRPFVQRKLQQTNRQDMVFIRLPGISDGTFHLRKDKIHAKTGPDTGTQCHTCAFVSVLEQYKGQ